MSSSRSDRVLVVPGSCVLRIRARAPPPRRPGRGRSSVKVQPQIGGLVDHAREPPLAQDVGQVDDGADRRSDRYSVLHGDVALR